MRWNTKVVASATLAVLGVACSAETADPAGSGAQVEDLTGVPGDDAADPGDATDEPSSSDGDTDTGAGDDAPADGSDDPSADDGSDDGPDHGGFERPDEVDDDYAELVVNELLRLETEVTDDAREQLDGGGSVPPELLERLRRITDETEFVYLASRLQQLVDDGFTGLREGELGSPTFEVDRVVEDTERCLVVVGTLDVSESAPANVDEPRVPYFTVLSPGDDEAPNDDNPTPWLLAGGGATADPEPSDYEEQCG